MIKSKSKSNIRKDPLILSNIVYQLTTLEEKALINTNHVKTQSDGVWYPVIIKTIKGWVRSDVLEMQKLIGTQLIISYNNTNPNHLKAIEIIKFVQERLIKN